MMFEVEAQAFSRQTGRPLAVPRKELIDTKTNELFRGSTTILGVKTAYESFWNDLNPASEEVVFVRMVLPVYELPQKGETKG